MRPPNLYSYQSRLKLSACVCFIQWWQAAPVPSGSVEEGGPKGGGAQGNVRHWQAGPFPGTHAIQGSSGPSSPTSSAPTTIACTGAGRLPLPQFSPFPVGSGVGWAGGSQDGPWSFLPERLPAVLFHVVLGTFAFKGGDEKS